MSQRLRADCDLIVRGELVLEQTVLRNGYLAVRDGRIVAIGADVQLPAATHILDYSGSLIFPGVVDSHVHTLSESTEGIGRATAAAAAGGVRPIPGVEMRRRSFPDHGPLESI
jgi:allantoinase